MHKGDKMLCAMLVDGKPTGETSAVTVCEVRRDGRTQEVQSVRVMTAKNKRGVWVQAQYLTPAEGDNGDADSSDGREEGMTGSPATAS